MTRFNATTMNGHDLTEVASAFQKSIRRGLEREALHWGIELDLSNFGEYAWKRMRVVTSEDVGLAEPGLPAQIFALYQNWCDQRKKRDLKHAPERLYFVHAILLLVRARKSRIVDHALIASYGNHTPWEIPDFALDKHTLRGKKLGRGVDHFFDQGVKLSNPSELVDDYELEARKTLKAGGQQSGTIPIFDEE
jgi:replication-associated recombination protein RarA